MMTIEEFTKNIEVELEGLEPGTLTADLNYRELEMWSSMYALIVLAYVDSVFNVTLSGDDLRNSNTVKDLYLLIKSRM